LHKTAAIGDDYQGEQQDARRFRGLDGWNSVARTPGADVRQVATRYLSPMEQRSHELGADARGLLQTADGKLADTSAASGLGSVQEPGRAAAGDGVSGRRKPDARDAYDRGKQIFVMSPSGAIRAIDPWEHHTEEQIVDGPDAGGTRMGFVNHSSLAADVSDASKVDRTKAGDLQAGEVAAAGELQIQKGKLEAISDSSGHYRPDNEMTGQAIDRLNDLGVDMHDTALKLTGAQKIKGAPVDKQTGKAPTRALHASVREFQEARKQVKPFQSPAALMVARREQLKDELEARVTARAQRNAAGTMRMTAVPGTKANAGDPARGSQDVKRRTGLLDPRRHAPLPTMTREERRQKRDELGPEARAEHDAAVGARLAARAQAKAARAALFSGYAV